MFRHRGAVISAFEGLLRQCEATDVLAKAGAGSNQMVPSLQIGAGGPSTGQTKLPQGLAGILQDQDALASCDEILGSGAEMGTFIRSRNIL